MVHGQESSHRRGSGALRAWAHSRRPYSRRVDRTRRRSTPEPWQVARPSGGPSATAPPPAPPAPSCRGTEEGLHRQGGPTSRGPLRQRRGREPVLPEPRPLGDVHTGRLRGLRVTCVLHWPSRSGFQPGSRQHGDVNHVVLNESHQRLPRTCLVGPAGHHTRVDTVHQAEGGPA